MIGRWIAAFFRFWYHFIIGDDWTIAALVAAGLIAVFALSRWAGIQAWWLLPPLVLLTLTLSLWRARNQRA